MWSVGHVNIVGLYQSIATAKKVHLVLELCQGNLEDLVRTEKKLREPLAAAIARQVMRAVEHCHQQDIVHRDLKLDNIMLIPQREGMGLLDGVPHVRVMCVCVCV